MKRDTVVDTEDRDVDVPVDPVEEPDPAAAADAQSVRDRVASGSVFSLRGFAIAVFLAVLGLLFVGTLLPLGALGDLLGVFLAAFVHGLLARASRYLEWGLAAGLVGGGAVVFGRVPLSLFGLGLPLIALGVGSGLLVGLLGHYFGSDLREGLTKEI